MYLSKREGAAAAPFSPCAFEEKSTHLKKPRYARVVTHHRGNPYSTRMERNMKKFFRILALGASFMMPALAPAADADFPSRPIKLVLGYAPGGSADIVAREFASLLSKELKQNVIVENYGGASGTIGAQMVANAAPDGYTLHFVASPTVTLTPALQKTPFDPLKDFTPIASIVDYVSVLMVNANSSNRSVNDLVERARTNPGAVTFGSSGVGSASHLAGEMLGESANVKLTHVPYKGNAPALTDLQAGLIDFVFDLTTTALANVASGRLRPLAVSSPDRNPAFPELPTMMELGHKNFNYSSWFGLLGPARMSEDVVSKISGATRRVVDSKDFRERMMKSGYVITSDSPEKLRDRIAREGKMFGDIVGRIGIGLRKQ